MTTQVAYTVGIVEPDGSVQYTGTLTVQLQISNLGSTPTSGLLEIGAFGSVLLNAFVDGAIGWVFTGDNGQLDVQSSAIQPVLTELGEAPSHIAGSISLQPDGGVATTLSLLGFLPAGIQEEKTEGASGSVKGRVHSDAVGTGDNLSFDLVFLDDTFANAGSGSIAATGRLVQVGPVAKYYQVDGTVVVAQPISETFPVSGGGGQTVWSVNGSAGSHTVELTAVPQDFIAPGTGPVAGVVTLDGGAPLFLVGSPSS